MAKGKRESLGSPVLTLDGGLLRGLHWSEEADTTTLYRESHCAPWRKQLVPLMLHDRWLRSLASAVAAYTAFPSPASTRSHMTRMVELWH